MCISSLLQYICCTVSSFRHLWNCAIMSESLLIYCAAYRNRLVAWATFLSAVNYKHSKIGQNARHQVWKSTQNIHSIWCGNFNAIFFYKLSVHSSRIWMRAVEMINCLLAALINLLQTFDRLQWIELFICAPSARYRERRVVSKEEREGKRKQRKMEINVIMIWVGQ